MIINTNARVDYQKNRHMEKRCPICGRKVKDTMLEDNTCFYCGSGIRVLEESPKRKFRKGG